MIRYNYNQQVTPPAPFVHVTVRRPDGVGDGVTIPALLDSGADKSVIPGALVGQLGLQRAGTFDVSGLAHATMQLPVYLVELGLPSFPTLIVDAIGVTEEDYILLGRDVLNGRRIILDGPQQVCTIE